MLSFVLLLAFLFPTVWAQGQDLQPQGWVSDFAQVLDAATKERLNALLAGVERQTTAEITVVVVDTTAPLTPKQYATELAQRWGVGKKKVDSGVLILLAVQDRRVEIETGYGIEGVLPDGKVGEIIRSTMLPHFGRNAWGAGLVAGVEAIAQVLRQGYATPQQPAVPDAPAAAGFGVLIGLAVVVVAGILFLGVIRKRRTRCPRCGSQLVRRAGIVQAPTPTHRGLREVIDDCPQCAYHNVEIVALSQHGRRLPRAAYPTVWPASVMLGGGGSGGDGSSHRASEGGGAFRGFGGGASGGGGAGASF